jgi:hypothetical protein
VLNSLLQVSSTDRLSVHICHACISYLNSWQSFKNRCDAAQRKQKIWLSTTQSSDGSKVQTNSSTSNNHNSSSNNNISTTGQSLLKNQLNGGQHLKPAIDNVQQKLQEHKQAQIQRQKLRDHVQHQQNQQSSDIDTSFIKSEPTSDNDVSKQSYYLRTH